MSSLRRNVTGTDDPDGGSDALFSRQTKLIQTRVLGDRSTHT